MRKGFIYGMFGCFGVAAAIVIFIIVAAAIGGAGKSTSNQSSPSPSVNSSPAKPKVWVPVAAYTGTGPKKTATFKVGNHWRVHFINHGDGNFIVQYVKPGDQFGQSITNVIGNVDQTTEEYEGGEFYLDVEAGDTWSLAVDEFR